jgi:hypothetical protein
MRFWFLRAAISLVLLGCFLCPVLEMFDHWDHTLKTGKDTESSVMILAVCVGAVISISVGEEASFLRPSPHKKGISAPSYADSNLFLIVRGVAAVSQPPPPLRI